MPHKSCLHLAFPELNRNIEVTAAQNKPIAIDDASCKHIGSETDAGGHASVTQPYVHRRMVTRRISYVQVLYTLRPYFCRHTPTHGDTSDKLRTCFVYVKTVFLPAYTDVW